MNETIMNIKSGLLSPLFCLKIEMNSIFLVFSALFLGHPQSEGE
jgi:hypothetical protein